VRINIADTSIELALNVVMSQLSIYRDRYRFLIAIDNEIVKPSIPEERTDVSTEQPDPTRGVYGISVAAELVGVGVQTLRLYERKGLVEPDRTDGGTRLYSEEDIARLRRIAELVAAGHNLTGVGAVLDLEDDNTQLQAEIDHLRSRRSPPGRPS
jgi:MerR family transcriptional regulator, heat shock protein HspR